MGGTGKSLGILTSTTYVHLDKERELFPRFQLPLTTPNQLKKITI